MEIESIKSVGTANSGTTSYVPPVSDTSGNSVKVVNDTQQVAVQTTKMRLKIRQMRTEK